MNVSASKLVRFRVKQQQRLVMLRRARGGFALEGCTQTKGRLQLELGQSPLAK